LNKILVFIPTFNEKENAAILCKQLLDLSIAFDILFLDDNSPDGTGQIIDQLCQEFENISVIHRAEKKGIGSAHMDGIKWAYDHNYDVLITMDCDFTHPPEYIPDFIKKAKDCDIVIGSRYLQKDSLKEWNVYRKILTNLAHFLTKTMLQMDYDATGAFRLYQLRNIPQSIFKKINSMSYSFFFESLYILFMNNYKIIEIPINLPARAYGHSKMQFKDAFRSLYLLFKTFFRKIFFRSSILEKNNEKSL